MEWEKPYMVSCIEALRPSGDVLEIGFGLGYSSTAIQKHKPKSHTIIECDPVVIAKAKEWAKQYPNVKIIEGTWQQNLAKLGVFDSIFFDDYSPLSQDEMTQINKNAGAFEQANDETQKVLDSLEEAIRSFKNVHFSDTDLQNFSKKVLKQYDVTPEYVERFINNLVEWGNITTDQKNAFLITFKKEAKMQKEVKHKPTNMQQTKQFPGDRFIAFVESCLDHHMHSGSRLSAYMCTPDSKLQHPEFQKRILEATD